MQLFLERKSCIRLFFKEQLVDVLVPAKKKKSQCGNRLIVMVLNDQNEKNLLKKIKTKAL